MEFKNIFFAFDVDENIKYSTIGRLCDTLINEKGDIRNICKNII